MGDLVVIPEEALFVKPTVSHSEVDSALRCERAHYYGYSLNLQRKTESTSLRRGTIGHAALDVYFKSRMAGKPEEECQKDAGDFLVELSKQDPMAISLIGEVLECLAWFFRSGQFQGWEVLAVEQEYVLEIYQDLNFPLVIDLMIRDPYGKIWVIDHKFMYDFLTDDDEELQSQLPKYVAALRILGFTVDKAGYSILRYRKIKEPSIDSKYRFVEARLTDKRIQRTFAEQAITAKRLREIKALPLEQQSFNAIRTQNKLVCKSCSYRSLCVAELNDYQPNLVLDSEYKQRERRDFVTADKLMIEGSE